GRPRPCRQRRRIPARFQRAAPRARSMRGFQLRRAPLRRLSSFTSKKISARFPGRFVPCNYCALPWPLLSVLVAVALPGAVRFEASPGPAVDPVLPEPLGVAALPELVAPPAAAP